MQRSAEAYVIAGPEIRRQLNLAFMADIEVDVDEEEATLREPWAAISQAAEYVRGIRGAERFARATASSIGRPRASGRPTTTKFATRSCGREFDNESLGGPRPSLLEKIL